MALRVKKINTFDTNLFRGSPLRTFYEDFKWALEARQPLIFIDTYDYELIDSMLKKLLECGVKQVFEFSYGVGVVDFETKRISNTNLDVYGFLEGFLNFTNISESGLVVIKNVPSNFEDDIRFVSVLRMLAGNNIQMECLVEEGCTSGEDIWKDSFIPIIIMSSGVQIPEPLQPFSKLFKSQKPNQDDIIRILKNFIDDSDRTLSQKELIKKRIPHLASYLSGMSETEIKLLLNTIVDLYPNQAASVIAQAKRDMVLKTGFLKLCNATEKDFAGLQNLKEELKRVKKVTDLRRMKNVIRLPRPKGVLLVGMPGCGKSLVANVAACSQYLDRPLIQLDIGKLLGKFVGQSESRMRRALDIAEAAAPCILWIDELEKAFSGLDSSDGTSKRLLGTFLTWLQEKTSDVYVIATANSVKNIPPELLRRGRFDEIFRLMLPTMEERKEMFKYHCEKLKCNFSDADYVKLAKNSNRSCDGKNNEEGFSGADIEYVVRSALCNSILEADSRDNKSINLNNVTPSVGDIIKEIRNMKGKTQRDRMDEYKEMKLYLDKSGFKKA
jgi:ATP-dependent 26S proteasome regulatory subunit